MKTRILLIFSFFLFANVSKGQFGNFYQYFDGADTIVDNSIFVKLDQSPSNLWQIGKPQKTIFNAAATFPNALVTDTINKIPTHRISSFQYHVPVSSTWGILAIQWKQKMDLDFGKDGGLIEFSSDYGSTWQSAFNNPYVYSFYGFDLNNVDIIASGEKCFTGIDTTWKDVWLCYDLTWLSQSIDTIMIRHTIISDSTDGNNEGWMIDNLMAHMTFIHTINSMEEESYLKVSPNPTQGRIDISTKKINEYHIIERMELMDINGQVLETWSFIPTKFFIDIGHYPNGAYFLNIKTNKKSEVVKVVLQK
jgi:hypothetical protein